MGWEKMDEMAGWVAVRAAYSLLAAVAGAAWRWARKTPEATRGLFRSTCVGGWRQS